MPQEEAYFVSMKKKSFLMKLKIWYAEFSPRFKNKYILTLFAFLIWMLFFDDNDFITRIKLKRQLARLKAEKEFYLKEMKKIEETNQQLFSSKETLEKFAREKYLMKRDNEEIFLIVEKKE